MSELFQRLQKDVPGLIFFPPAMLEQIARVETRLGTPFPKWLRDLYLCTNGIKSPGGQDEYLFAIEKNEDFYSDLLGANLEQRQTEDERIEIAKRNRPEVDWEALHVRHRLLIGVMTTTLMAIDPKGGSEISVYTLSDPNERSVLGQDLAEACATHQNETRRAYERIYRGRTSFKRDADLPPTSDIELLYDMLVEVYRGSRRIPMRARGATSPGWKIFRGTSQRQGENGCLYILQRSFTVRIASRDSNLPFILRARPTFYQEPITCLVKGLPDAILCILQFVDLEMWGPPDASARRAMLESTWRHLYGPEDPELEQMAEVLFKRDDRRLQEDNPVGE